MTADFVLEQRFVVNVDNVLGFLHHVAVGVLQRFQRSLLHPSSGLK